MVTVRLLLLFFIIGIVSGCGFHLRGTIPFPNEIKTLYIKSDKPFGGFEQALRATLAQYKINIVANKKDAPIILNVLSAKIKRNNGGMMFGENGASFVSQTFVYIVSYNLLSKNNDVILPVETVSSTITNVVNRNEMMLGANSEVAQYLPKLQNDVITRIIYQLTSNNARKALHHYFHKRT